MIEKAMIVCELPVLDTGVKRDQHVFGLRHPVRTGCIIGTRNLVSD